VSTPATTQPVEVQLPEPLPLPKGERERRAFLRLLPQLLKTHYGQFVAIHNGQVVDRGADDIALIRRVHARIGYVPIHVARVVENPAVERIPGPRNVKPAE
jgi:hypothetical protein